MKSEKRMFISFLLNFFFTIIEFIGGIITNSVALISDSIHDLGDSISIGIAIFLERKSKQRPDKIYTYGYRRFSLLGALISSMILVFGSTFVVIESIQRLMHPESINSELLIYFAIFGVIVNGLAAFNISKGKSLNEKAISLHLLEDVIGWLALLIGAIIMHFTDILAIDALLSLLFTIWILYHVFKNMKNVFKVLLERAPSGFDISAIEKKLSNIKHVLEVHHLHLWSLEGETPLITVHALLENKLSQDTITDVQNKLIKILSDFGIEHSTVQIEFKNTDCINEECLSNKPLDIGKHHHNH
ncbi:MAG: cation transporter [Tenericutes bacterium]|nr:cation transporter [Mycoplasmatota bacterium]